MKLLNIFLCLFFTAQVAQASNDIDTSDESMINLAEAIGDEVENYQHKDRAMKWAFKKLRNAYRQLNRRARIPVPKSVSDQDIFELLQSIVTEIDQNNHRKNKLRNAYKKMLKTLKGLERKRIEETGMALLEFSNPDPFNFGTTTVNTTINASFTITNSGTESATTITASVIGAFNIIGGTCLSVGTLVPAASCSLDVEFAPTGAGSSSEILEISYDSGTQLDTVSKELQGFGI